MSRLGRKRNLALSASVRLLQMTYAVKFAIFPPWKAPILGETVGTFATTEEASRSVGWR